MAEYNKKWFLFLLDNGAIMVNRKPKKGFTTVLMDSAKLK